MKKLWKGMAILLCLTMILSLCACQGNSGKTGGETVNLVWYVRSTEPKGFAEVQQAINEYTTNKIGATVEIRFIQPGDWKEKTNMMMAAREEYDLIFSGDWAADFANMVDMGALTPLNDLLKKTPKLKKMYSDSIWEATSFGGEIYGVPNNQVIYEQKGLWFKKDIVEKYDLPVKDIKSIDDLTKLYDIVKAGEPVDFIPARRGFPTQFDALQTTVKGFEIHEGKVVDPFDSNLDKFKVMRTWYEKGFLPADVSTLTDDTAIVKAGKLFSSYNRYLPGVADKFNLTHDYDVIAVPTVDPFILRASVQSAMTSVSATSKNPQKAVELLELVQTDKELLNLICYGIEGRDYEKDATNENRINRSADSYYLAEFMIGNQFLAYLQPSYSDTVWQETEEENKKAPADPNIGFAFDQDPVKTEITNLDSVSKEFAGVMDNGLAENTEETFKKIQEKKSLAGRDKVMEEIQNQYDAWLAQQ